MWRKLTEACPWEEAQRRLLIPDSQRGCLGDLSTLRRFVTKAELAKLGIGHLVGTPLLRAYMHGFFLHNRLWKKARAIAEPFLYDSYRQQRVTAKVEAERKSRIGLERKLPKVRLG